MEAIPYPADYFEPIEEERPVMAVCDYCEKDLYAGDEVVDLREHRHNFILCPVCAGHLFQVSVLECEHEDWGECEC